MARRRDLPRPGRRRRRRRRGDPGLAARHAVPARRRHQRPRRRAAANRSGRATTSPTRGSRTTPTTTTVAERLGLRGMAAAPLRAPGGEVIGTLAISSRDAARVRARGARPPPGPRRPGRHRDHQLDAADPPDRVRGALPLPRRERAGPRLVDRRRARADVPLGRASSALTGRPPPTSCSASTSGRSCHESSREVAELDWSAGMAAESQELRGRVNLLGPDGDADPGRVHRDGPARRGRSVRRRQRLGPRHARARPPRARAARVARSATGSSSRTRRTSSSRPTPRAASRSCPRRWSAMTGWTRPARSIGDHFSMTRRPGSPAARGGDRWATLVADPATEQVAEHQRSSGPDGRLVPVEVSAIGDGRRGGHVRGHPRRRPATSASASAPRARAARVGGALPLPRRVVAGPRLADRRRGDPDASSATPRETMLGIEPTELIGRPYWRDLRPRGRAATPTVRFRWLARHPTPVHRMRLPFRHADGHDVLVEINGIGMTADGGRSSGRTARRATSASATGSSATCAARPASWPPARSGPTSPASSTTR